MLDGRVRSFLVKLRGFGGGLVCLVSMSLSGCGQSIAEPMPTGEWSTAESASESLRCTLPAGDSTSEQLNTQSCAGRVLATGSMDNHDERSYAEARCASAGVTGSCCSYHLFGEGAWFLTDGVPVADGGVPYETSWGRSAGTCSGQTPSP